MCGIAGTVNWGDADSLQTMADLLTHRGPDDAGLWLRPSSHGPRVGLASRRLSILDLSPAGHMPMRTHDGALTLVYNGECYNYPQLRRDLEARGHRFRSTSDTEAVLFAWREWGPDCLRRFNGMFAIALWDEEQRKLFLARDHIGIKPLYYCSRPGQLAFASEMKSILTLRGFSRELEPRAVQQFLSLLWVPDPLTLMKGILKLPAGHYATFDGTSLTLTQYWDLEFPSADAVFPPRDENDLAAEVRQRFFSAVQSQMLSDVPVGAFLSAGLDSSGIVAAMAQQSNSPVNTFTIGFPPGYCRGDVRMDDVSVARRTAERFGCRHTEILVEPDVVNLLPKLVWHMDEPTADPQILVSYLVCREARRSVTVLLSGLGGDEVFGGYRKYRAHRLAQQYRRLPAWLRNHLLEPAAQALPNLRGTHLANSVRLTKKMARSASHSDRDRFLTDSVYMSRDLIAEVCRDSFVQQVSGFDPLSRHRDYFDRVAGADFLNQMLYLDTKAFMVSLNLNVADKTSMACSVETRVPFLDWQFAQWVASNVPPHLKLQGSSTKHIYRRALRNDIPEEAFHQRKAGFTAPIDFWIANDLQRMLGDVLNPAAIRSRGIYDPEALTRMIREQRSGHRSWSYQIWQALTFELWAQSFLDNNLTQSPAACAPFAT
ncbi:MAG: asparagine synthase (glutamine-hydrolyzing) [Acidobacteriaceae bacterium]